MWVLEFKGLSFPCSDVSGEQNEIEMRKRRSGVGHGSEVSSKLHKGEMG